MRYIAFKERLSITSSKKELTELEGEITNEVLCKWAYHEVLESRRLIEKRKALLSNLKVILDGDLIVPQQDLLKALNVDIGEKTIITITRTPYTGKKYPDVEVEKTLQDIVCDFFGVTLSDLKGKSRKGYIVQARQLLMYFLYFLTTESLDDVSAQYNRDHATLLHGARMIKNSPTEAQKECCASIVGLPFKVKVPKKKHNKLLLDELRLK